MSDVGKGALGHRCTSPAGMQEDAAGGAEGRRVRFSQSADSSGAGCYVGKCQKTLKAKRRHPIHVGDNTAPGSVCGKVSKGGKMF